MARISTGAITYGGSGWLSITPESISGLEQYLRYVERIPHRLAEGMNQLALACALIQQKEAKKRSAGPIDPGENNPGAAWRVPVRRISETYFNSWKVRQAGRGTWLLYNDSREAYFIEFGISRVGFGGTRTVPGRRIRRPINKLSMRATLFTLMRTQAYHRIFTNVFADPRHRGTGGGWSQTGATGVVRDEAGRISGLIPGGQHSMFAPMGAAAAASPASVHRGPVLGRRLPK